ncbi:MAG: hypothetical protein HKP27_16055, partial [Myxococcales bacterium]|nr:hypothetical protein [Myxococcales bacterium]
MALALYGALLGASHAVRSCSDPNAHDAGSFVLVEDPKLGPSPVRVAYVDLGPRDAETLFLVHG